MNKDKLKFEVERDQAWAEIRDKEEDLLKILINENPNTDDINLALTCVRLIAGDLILYKNEYKKKKKKYPENLKAIDLMSDISKVIFSDTSSENKLNLINEFREKIWNNLIENETLIMNLASNGPQSRSKKNAIQEVNTIIQCICLIITEIILKKIELRIIENNYLDEEN
jgi:hypothetical protein